MGVNGIRQKLLFGPRKLNKGCVGRNARRAKSSNLAEGATRLRIRLHRLSLNLTLSGSFRSTGMIQFRHSMPVSVGLPDNRIVCRSFGRNAAGRFGKALDPFLDVSECLQADFNCVGLDILQHIGCDGIA
jgi:hypothetical protein